MDTFRKWLNKPKADDKSLLARFYHADRSLTAVASELDSFDGRAEPDRCSRLVTRLRQGQDKVLAITNLIMEELLGDERDGRAFRAKFPEEVLQENLAGQLWFGAECLAAGSSIMNREQESKEMRPLAQAVTKSLVNVRSLLREQCLRSNVPNSKKLHLDVNDANTEQLYESLKIFDRLFAEFELRYVSAMVQVKTKEEYEMQELICVLFSETLHRAIKLELIEQDKVDSFDPGLMFSIPRLAIITGLIVYPQGPLNMDMPAEDLSEMFRPFRTILTKIRDLLCTLTKDELFQLEKLLCTNEDIHKKIPIGSSSIEAPIGDQQRNKSHNQRIINPDLIDDENTKDLQNREAAKVFDNKQDEGKSKAHRFAARSPSLVSSISADSSIQRSTPHSSRSSSCSRTASHSIPTTTTASDTYISMADNQNWSDDEHDVYIDDSNDLPSVDGVDTDELSSDAIDEDDDQAILTADCASGYLIPNTNFGNLLQPNEIPLTGNFVASDNEFVAQLRALGLEGADMPNLGSIENYQEFQTSQRLNPLRLSDSSEETETRRETSTAEKNRRTSTSNCSSCSGDFKTRESTSSRSFHQHHHHHHKHNNNNYYHRHYHQHSAGAHHHCVRSCHSKAKKRHSVSEYGNSDKTSSADISPSEIMQRRPSADVSSTSSLSDNDSNQGVLIARGRMKFKNTENLLHRLFVCISGVADQLQTNFASDLRQILRGVFLMNMKIAEEEIDIPEKPSESEMFEFRASETDVIQESGGSNQSIYSAEEVNAELDNVFNHNTNSRTRTTVQHVAMCGQNTNGGQLARSRSVGDENQYPAENEVVATTSRRSSNCINGRSFSSSSPMSTQRQITSAPYIDRKTSLSSNNLPSSSPSTTSSPTGSESDSLGSENINNNNNSHQNNETFSRISPPAWIPDEKAPRCMSCRTPFTAFRRRHHCRNCGGVFCGVCSNASTPLPKYGLTKAVRVCRECYMREIISSASNSEQQYNCTVTRTMHTTTNSSTTAGGL